MIPSVGFPSCFTALHAFQTLPKEDSVESTLTPHAGPGSVLMNVIRQANITYAGGKNSTRINGLGTVADGPAIVNYFNSGAHPLWQVLVMHCCASTSALTH